MDKVNKEFYFIGITGAIGSGKTTVSNILRRSKYSVFDTDLFSKKLLKEDKSIIVVIENIIGQKVSENSKLDFKRIGKIFDENLELERKFEKWYQVFLGHKIVKEKVNLKSDEKFIFLDIPLLNQKGIVDKLDYVWIIESKEAKLYERVKNRNNYSNEKIENLLRNSKIDKSLILSSYKIIDNNHSVEELEILIKHELDNLKAIYF